MISSSNFHLGDHTGFSLFNIFSFIVFLVILIIYQNSTVCAQKVSARVSYEPEDPGTITLGKPLQKWEQAPTGLQGSFGSINQRYLRNQVPDVDRTNIWSGVAWRGERINAQIVLWSATGVRNVNVEVLPLKNQTGDIINSSNIHPRFVRYVIADNGQQKCGPISPDSPKKLIPDILDKAEKLDLAEYSVRPIWVIIDVPNDAKPGTYKGKLFVTAGGLKTLQFEMNLEILNRTLPEPSNWSFHLDLWQNPYAVARYHRIRPWSEEHWLLLKPLLRMLADAGQKCITTSIIYKPWAGQTYDHFESMIKWIRKKNGEWQFDYEIFDKWVAFCEGCGIKKQINCYSMVAWSNSFRYFDKATRDYKYVIAEPGTDNYEKHWRQFLKDFSKHLEEKGWLEKTTVAMDERPLKAMQNVIDFVKKTAPGLKVTLAGNYHSEIKYDIHDLCVFIQTPVKPELIKERVDRSLPTTFYVCCGPEWPNTFTYSPPAESTWQGWYAAAQGYSGFLRWAYNSWVEDPLQDTRFVSWPAGDCFLVYPGARSSIRFERLREGIQDYEKIQILKRYFTESNKKDKLDKLNTMLDKFVYDPNDQKSHENAVREGKKLLLELSL